MEPHMMMLVLGLCVLSEYTLDTVTTEVYFMYANLHEGSTFLHHITEL